MFQVDAIRNNHWEPSEMGLILTNLIDRVRLSYMVDYTKPRVLLLYLKSKCLMFIFHRYLDVSGPEYTGHP